LDGDLPGKAWALFLTSRTRLKYDHKDNGLVLQSILRGIAEKIAETEASNDALSSALGVLYYLLEVQRQGVIPIRLALNFLDIVQVRSTFICVCRQESNLSHH
jgi:hypothetical protein